jgi:1,4-alpha-glucan branching enzyme
MSESLGTLCIVLHGHLPYVLHHGSWPHGEAWLYEAAAETYLPLLDMVGEAALMKSRPALTIGLTPILLEQLSHQRFKDGFVIYCNERIDRAKQDEADFKKAGDGHKAYLAQRWQDWFNKKLEHFDRIGRDIPAEFGKRFREGHIQILTSNATHAYMPLLLNDQMMAAQMKAGTNTSKRVLGIQPRGMWLPECAYRPQWDHWNPAVLYDNPRHRPGVEKFIADAGVTHFFVDTHMVTSGQPLGIYEKGNFRSVSEQQLHWDQKRGWRHPLEPTGVASWPEAPKTYAFARHPKISEQVWSGSIGYPGAGQYMEFHRKHGDRGLRYHKVTSNKTDLSAKELYYPDDIPAKVFEHAQHFVNVVKQVLGEYKFWSGREGVCVAPFDAELFGHWWFEGVQFLRDVILTLANDSQVKLMTAEEAMYHHPPDKVMRLPEGSWGENGNHSVWINDKVKWMWEIEYRAEGRMLKCLHELPWKTNTAVKELMDRGARELLLLQASDWPFVIHTQGAVDYGIQRFSGHATNFDRMMTLAEKVAKGLELDEVDKAEMREVDLHDSVFMDVDLNWWM